MNKRPMRCMPTAISPVQFGDLLYAMSQQNKIDGHSEFERLMSSYLGVKGSYSFTSFMRATYACLSCLRNADKRNEIIVPRYCCPSFFHAVLAAGLKIKYCE